MNPGTMSVLGMLAGLGIDIMDALPRRSQSARHDRKNDGTTDEEKSAAVKRARKRAKWEAAIVAVRALRAHREKVGGRGLARKGDRDG